MHGMALKNKTEELQVLLAETKANVNIVNKYSITDSVLLTSYG